MAVEACEFQTDPSRIRFNDLKNVIQSEKDTLSFNKYHNLWISFLEQYKTYENSKRSAPTFAEMVHKINARQLFEEAPEINTEIKKLYEKLSDYVHPDYLKIESYMLTNRKPYPIFDEKGFITLYNYGLEVLDLVEFLYIVTIANYHSVSGKQLITEYSEAVIIDGRKKNFFMNLPHIKKLSGSASWQFRLKRKTKTKSKNKSNS
jgi:hypothetical protein